MGLRGRNTARQLALLWVVALLLRLAATQWKLATYPDEFHQYVEPAYVRLYGIGQLPWEFLRGARSWWLTLVYGSVLGFADVVHVHSPRIVYGALQCVTVLFSLGLTWAALRLVEAFCDRPASKFRAGRVTLIVFGAAPLVLSWSMHLLSETPAAATFVLGWALLEHRRWWRASSRWPLLWDLLGGFALASCVMMRVVQAPLIPIPVLVALFHRMRWRSRFARAGVVLLGAVFGCAAFGLLDRLTWGAWFHSTIEYVKFNVIEDGSRGFGVSGPFKYLQWIQVSWGLSLIPVLGSILLQIRRTWAPALTSGILLLVLSLTPHKEERFLIPVHVLLLVSFCIALAHGSRRWQRWRSKWLPWALGATVLICQALPFLTTPRATLRSDSPILDLQLSASTHADLTGLLTPGIWHRTGGSFLLGPPGHHAPQAQLSDAMLQIPLFNYVIASPHEVRMAERRGFTEIDRADGYVLLHRP